MTEVEIWRHQLSGDEFEQTLGDSEGQESLECSVYGIANIWTPLWQKVKRN